jgi:hypothetical protein
LGGWWEGFDGGGAVVAKAGVCDELACIPDAGATAAAAAVAYRIGGMVAGGAGRGGCGSPAFKILAIGCCAKFKFGGGFATKYKEISDEEEVVLKERSYCLQTVLQRKCI